VLGEAVALAPQFLQLLWAQRVTEQFVGVAAGVERRADMGLQQPWTQAAGSKHTVKGFHGRAVERDVAQDQRAGAGLSRLAHQFDNRIFGRVAIEQRRAQRAVGIGAHQSGQGDIVGAPHRDDRQEADHARRVVGRKRSIAPRAQRRHSVAPSRGGVHRQFPVGQIIAVRLDGAFGQSAPLAHRDGGERCACVAIKRRYRRRHTAPDDLVHRCAMGHRRICNLDHVPDSPFAGIGGASSCRPFHPRLSDKGLAERLENRVGAKLQFEREC